MDSTNEKKQMLTIDSRRRMEVDGVKHVAEFSEEFLELETNLGHLSVEGVGLKILDLSGDSGSIVITGEISGVFYGGERISKGLFGKIFK